MCNKRQSKKSLHIKRLVISLLMLLGRCHWFPQESQVHPQYQVWKFKQSLLQSILIGQSWMFPLHHRTRSCVVTEHGHRVFRLASNSLQIFQKPLISTRWTPILEVSLKSDLPIAWITQTTTHPSQLLLFVIGLFIVVIISNLVKTGVFY